MLNDADHGTVLGNSAGHNGLSGIAVTAGSDANQVSANDTSKNSRDGIELVDSTGNTVKSNVADSNGRYGISEAEPDGSVDNTYANNLAEHNAVANFFPQALRRVAPQIGQPDVEWSSPVRQTAILPGVANTSEVAARSASSGSFRTNGPKTLPGTDLWEFSDIATVYQNLNNPTTGLQRQQPSGNHDVLKWCA